MVEVGRFDTRTDAQFARSLLAAAGIPCVLAPDEVTGAYPIDLAGRTRVLVADADAHDAAVILGHHAPSEEDHG
jgi:Putative prokaryotic signal transducing protein